MYSWEHPDWPDLTWDSAHLAALLGQAVQGVARRELLTSDLNTERGRPNKHCQQHEQD